MTIIVRENSAQDFSDNLAFLAVKFGFESKWYREQTICTY